MQCYYYLTQIKHFVPRVKHRVWVVSFIFIMLLAACQSTEITEPENIIAENNTDLSPLLIQAEDMGWSSGYYDVDKEFDLPPFGPTPPQEVWLAIISPIPGTGGGKYPISHDDLRLGMQTVSVFKDEITAKKEFESLTEHFLSLSAAGWTLCNVPSDDRIDNVFARCHNFDTSGLGWLEDCDVKMQLGPYLVEVGLVIDGHITTKQDWVNMFEIAQERLIEHVVQASK